MNYPLRLKIVVNRLFLELIWTASEANISSIYRLFLRRAWTTLKSFVGNFCSLCRLF